MNIYLVIRDNDLAILKAYLIEVQARKYILKTKENTHLETYTIEPIEPYDNQTELELLRMKVDELNRKIKLLKE